MYFSYVEEVLHFAHEGQHMYLLCFGSFDVDFIFSCFITDFNYGLAAYKNRETIQKHFDKEYAEAFSVCILNLLFRALYSLPVKTTDGI